MPGISALWMAWPSRERVKEEQESSVRRCDSAMVKPVLVRNAAAAGQMTTVARLAGWLGDETEEVLFLSGCDFTVPSLPNGPFFSSMLSLIQLLP